MLLAIRDKEDAMQSKGESFLFPSCVLFSSWTCLFNTRKGLMDCKIELLCRGNLYQKVRQIVSDATKIHGSRWSLKTGSCLSEVVCCASFIALAFVNTRAAGTAAHCWVPAASPQKQKDLVFNINVSRSVSWPSTGLCPLRSYSSENLAGL